jgi:hypothetical protein
MRVVAKFNARPAVLLWMTDKMFETAGEKSKNMSHGLMVRMTALVFDVNIIT